MFGFAGEAVLTAGEERRGKEVVADPPVSGCFFYGGAWTHAPPVAVVREIHAPPLFQLSKLC